MNRREAIRNFMFISSAVFIFPSCLRQGVKGSMPLNHLEISEQQGETLEALVEAFIPQTDTPGGKELQLQLFVLKMVDDCHHAEDQEGFTRGLTLFESTSRKALGESFVSASPEKKEAFLRSIGEDTTIAAELALFYKITKQRTIQGYMNSKYVMTNLVKYELVPGRYNGYMPV